MQRDTTRGRHIGMGYTLVRNLLSEQSFRRNRIEELGCFIFFFPLEIEADEKGKMLFFLCVGWVD